ncbi:MAG: hypothetical protein LBS19_01190 [Clostridiales bacterium]|jgi:hypothetical protein|nr:hypothetical protein [Clostridiales bacterium]
MSIITEIGHTPETQKSPDGKDMPPLRFPKPLPFYCEHSVRRCVDGFYIGGDCYGGKDGLFREEIGKVSHKNRSVNGLTFYRDEYGRHFI